MSGGLTIRGLSAGYGPIRVLQGVDLEAPEGEITVVVAGAAEEEVAPDDAFVARAYDLLAAELPPSRAAALVAQLTGRRRSEIYARGNVPLEILTGPESQ